MMLRHRHRHSFDIDIFVDDPQTLGYISPRLNDTSENFSSHYIEQGGFVKMFLPDGEVDFIVAPTLTDEPVTDAFINGRLVKIETDIEIVAKKIFYRSKNFTGRDVFDLCFLLEDDPLAHRVLSKIANISEKLVDIETQLGKEVTKKEFSAVRSISFTPVYEDAANKVMTLVNQEVKRKPRL